MSTASAIPLSADIRVHDLLAAHPGLTPVFARSGMNCPGCPFDSFHTIADACREHHRDLQAFMAALRIALGNERMRNDAHLGAYACDAVST